MPGKSKSDLDKLSAAQRIRGLLQTMSVSAAVPPDLQEAAALSAKLNWGAVYALTRVRNALTHS